MLVHRWVTHSIKFAGTHLYTSVRRGTVRIKCLAQEHNTMSPARAQTRNVRSEVELANLTVYVAYFLFTQLQSLIRLCSFHPHHISQEK